MFAAREGLRMNCRYLREEEENSERGDKECSQGEAHRGEDGGGEQAGKIR